MKKSSAKNNLLVPILLALVALIYFTQRGADVSTSNTSQPETNAKTVSSLSSQSNSSPEQLIPGDSMPGVPMVVRKSDELPEEFQKALTSPPPPTPADIQAQISGPPPELPEEMRRQLESPPPPLPPDLQAQLNAPPPELPEDLKRALETPPRVVGIDEVNEPPQ